MQLTISILEDWALVIIKGQDSEKYLQSQLTADVTQITKNKYILTAHCDPQGKMLSNMYLFKYEDGFAYIERRSIREIQLAELKKYSLFSNITITANDELILLGIAGLQARAALKKFFHELPNAEKQIVNNGATYILWFKYPIERFLLIIDISTALIIISYFNEKIKAQIYNSEQWVALNIEAGIPIIEFATSRKFLPQATNIQAFGGISFNKGCYIGQEMIARAKFRGVNKRSMWYLAGMANYLPNVGDNLEYKIEDQWRSTGIVLASVQLKTGIILVQTVMSNNIKLDTLFRLREKENTWLKIKPLPYSI